MQWTGLCPQLEIGEHHWREVEFYQHSGEVKILVCFLYPGINMIGSGQTIGDIYTVELNLSTISTSAPLIYIQARTCTPPDILAKD